MQNGWLAIAEGSGSFASARTAGAIECLDRAKETLQANTSYDRLSENGNIVILNNGIAFAATYTIRLLVIFIIGIGKASVDYFINKKFNDCNQSF